MARDVQYWPSVWHVMSGTGIAYDTVRYYQPECAVLTSRTGVSARGERQSSNAARRVASPFSSYGFATRCPVLTCAMILPGSMSLSSYGFAMQCPVLTYATSRMRLKHWEAMTEVPHPLSSYARAMRCPVLA
eukprot:3941591-Rhodomonas_salina.5